MRVELRAWREIRSGFAGLVHFMWAERDWGFLDLLPGSNRLALCATFHSCPDTLQEIVSNPSRLQKLSAIILMSEIQRPFFLSHGVSADRIHVIRHGIDCSHFSTASPREEGPFTVLTVGEYRRNFPLLREVCLRLASHRDIRIKVVGARTRKALFEGMANVEFLSELCGDELLSLYQNASCLLMTLESATANNAILEAMACGLPIVSEDVGGVREYTGSECAILCKPGSAGALTEAVVELHESRGLRSRMSALARRRAELLNWPLVARQTAEVYEKVLAERRIGMRPERSVTKREHAHS
jgi:glycosyltransferase involved in cell wall biosynthesis